MCVFEILIAVPDEYILNISKISENEATDSPQLWLLLYYMLCIIQLTIAVHDSSNNNHIEGVPVT